MANRAQRIRSALTSVLTAFVLGILTNLCVTTALVFHTHRSLTTIESQSSLHPNDRWRWKAKLSDSAEIVCVDPFALPDPSDGLVNRIYRFKEFKGFGEMLGEPSRPPAWTIASLEREHVAERFGTLPIYWREERFGWPCRWAYQAWLLDDRNSLPRLWGGVELNSSVLTIGDMLGEERGFPYTIQYAGALINTAFFATFWLLLIHSLRQTRMLRRAKRNRCMACGYDRGGIPGTSPCPECGVVYA